MDEFVPKKPTQLYTCRSELARDGVTGTAGCQVSSVIVGDHREQARSYRDGNIALAGAPYEQSEETRR